jgi:hypothetical protein
MREIPAAQVLPVVHRALHKMTVPAPTC